MFLNCLKHRYKCSLTTAPSTLYMTKQDKNSIGLSFNQRLIKRKKREIGGRREQT